MKKSCELCKGVARVHCEADEANLCWDCDAVVHSNNFLAARHSRNLLCNFCHSPMPWSATGAKLVPLVSVCQQCVNRRIRGKGRVGHGEELPEEIDENQAEAWSPPSAAEESSLSSEGSESGGEAVSSRKRCRFENSSSNHPFYVNSDRSPCMLTTPLQKMQKTDSVRFGVCDPRVLESPMKKIDREEAGSDTSNSGVAIDLLLHL